MNFKEYLNEENLTEATVDVKQNLVFNDKTLAFIKNTFGTYEDENGQYYVKKGQYNVDLAKLVNLTKKDNIALEISNGIINVLRQK